MDNHTSIVETSLELACARLAQAMRAHDSAKRDAPNTSKRIEKKGNTLYVKRGN